MDTEPLRQNFWNIPGWAQGLLYGVMALAVAAFLAGLYRRLRVWRAGRLPASIISINGWAGWRVTPSSRSGSSANAIPA